LEVIGSFVFGTIVQCLPALVALMAWGEGGHRILRQFGTRMLWELAGLVVVGIAILLYAMLRVLVDEGANIFVIVVAALCAVLAVTAATYRFQASSPPVRVAVTAGASLLALQGGLALGVFAYMLIWHPQQ
jgi:hypothetical protein